MAHNVSARVGLFLFFTFLTGCAQKQPARDTGDPGFPLGPSNAVPQALSYDKDLQPILYQDCLQCHNEFRAFGGYSVQTWAETVAGQRVGDASNRLVTTTQPGGSMYGFWTGDAQTKAAMVFRWVVVYHEQEHP